MTEKKSNTANYWIVGANWNDDGDYYEEFIRRGYWILGWDKKSNPRLSAKRDQIQNQDRIAIKRMLGRGAKEIEIRAIGIVNEVDQKDNTVYVQWIITDMERRVPAKGKFSAIHGPYTNNQWVNKVFCI